MRIWAFEIYQVCFKSFASLIRSLCKKSTNGPQTKKLYSPVYNLIFNIITIPNEAIFVSSDEFVDTSSITHQSFFSKKLVTVFSDFHHHETAVLPRNRIGQEMSEKQWVRVWRVSCLIEYIPTESSLLVLGHRYRCHCHRYFSHHRITFNQLLQNFACVLGIPSVKLRTHLSTHRSAPYQTAPNGEVWCSTSLDITANVCAWGTCLADLICMEPNNILFRVK